MKIWFLYPSALKSLLVRLKEKDDLHEESINKINQFLLVPVIVMLVTSFILLGFSAISWFLALLVLSIPLCWIYLHYLTHSYIWPFSEGRRMTAKITKIHVPKFHLGVSIKKIHAEVDPTGDIAIFAFRRNDQNFNPVSEQDSLEVYAHPGKNSKYALRTNIFDQYCLSKSRLNDLRK